MLEHAHRRLEEAAREARAGRSLAELLIRHSAREAGTERQLFERFAYLLDRFGDPNLKSLGAVKLAEKVAELRTKVIPADKVLNYLSRCLNARFIGAAASEEKQTVKVPRSSRRRLTNAGSILPRTSFRGAGEDISVPQHPETNDMPALDDVHAHRQMRCEGMARTAINRGPMSPLDYLVSDPSPGTDYVPQPVRDERPHGPQLTGELRGRIEFFARLGHSAPAIAASCSLGPQCLDTIKFIVSQLGISPNRRTEACLEIEDD